MDKSGASVEVKNWEKGKKKDNGGEREKSQSQMSRGGGGELQKW